MTTHVIFVTDKSGSMYELAEDVRGGFNSQIQDLKDNPEPDVEFRITVTLFDQIQYVFCQNAPLANVEALDKNTYKTGGSTALLDAVGDTISRFKESNVESEGDKVLLIIQTDGQENASTKYGAKMIADRLEKLKEEGWAVLYLGQGIDAWQQGGQMLNTSSNYVAATSHSTRSSYGAVGQTMRAYSTEQVKAESISDWFEIELKKAENEPPQVHTD